MKMCGKSKVAALLAALMLAAFAAGCASQAEVESASSQLLEETAVPAADAAEVSAVELSSTYGGTAITGEATTIALSGSTATVSGSGATVVDGVVTITQGGSYVLSGGFSGGIVVTAPSTDKVELILNGVDISATKNAAIYCAQADKLIITLAEGSENSVSDAASYTYSDATAEEPDAAIFSKKDLTIQGSGSLTVTAGYNNGIGSKDDLEITGGTLRMTATNHGIRGRDSVTVTGGDFTIQAGADGIQSNNDEKEDKGWISLENGSFTITAGNDAVQAETTLTVSGGSYTLTAGGGNTATPSDTTGSYKGMKAGSDMAVSGGAFVIDSADDGVHANGDISITGGAFTISTGDDGVHADGDLTVEGADTNIKVLASYEGLEAYTMTLAGGVIDVNATDDGINVAGGDGSGDQGRFGRESFDASNSDHWLKITGGTITVVAGRDGIDINGVGEMTGGTLHVTAATLGEGDTIDSDGTFQRLGGDITEVGGNAMGGPGGRGGGPGGRNRGVPLV